MAMRRPGRIALALLLLVGLSGCAIPISIPKDDANSTDRDMSMSADGASSDQGVSQLDGSVPPPGDASADAPRTDSGYGEAGLPDGLVPDGLVSEGGPGDGSPGEPLTADSGLGDVFWGWE